MAEEGATQAPKVPLDPVDACPRINGKGPHVFHWKSALSNEVVCINCGQERKRTAQQDTVIKQGATSFPLDAPPPVGVPGELGMNTEPLAQFASPEQPDTPPEPLVGGAPPQSFAGGGATGEWTAAPEVQPAQATMTSAPSVVADNSAPSSGGDSGGGSSSSGSD